MRLCLIVLLLCLFAPAAWGQEQVLLTTPQALREVFPRAAGVVAHPWRPTAAQQATLARQLGRPAPLTEYPFLLVYDGANRLLGYALQTEERGKYRPITFMVGITPELRVGDVAVMVYRESRGGEVRQERFLRQYRGKTTRSPIRSNRDIVGISGATISVHSLNTGVRRALAAAALAFGPEPPPLLGAVRPLASLR